MMYTYTCMYIMYVGCVYVSACVYVGVYVGVYVCMYAFVYLRVLTP